MPPPEQPRYELVAVLGNDTARVEHPVRLKPAPLRLTTDGPLAYDTMSVTPGSRLALRDDDTVRVSVRTAPNASVVWLGDANAAQALTAAGTSFAADMPARMLRARTELLLTRGRDTIRVAVPPVGVALPNQWAMLGPDSTGVDATDVELIGRPVPGGTYKWFFLPGTALEVTGRNGDFSRVRLDSQLEIWVSTSDLHALPPAWLPIRRTAGNVRIESHPEWVDLVVPMPGRPPYLVEEGAHELTVTLYGTTINTDLVNYGANDSLVSEAKWTQETSERGHFTLRLSSPEYGYLAFWQNGAFVLRVRRPPRIDATAPLKGLTIAIDPGHPPIGATGPTGLFEPVPTLAVGLVVQQLLEQRGAKVVMTRTTADPVALGDRPDHRAQGERERARLDPPERAAGRNQSVHEQRNGRVLLPLALDRPRARAAAGDARAHGPAQSRDQLRQPASRAAHVDARCVVRGRVPHDSRAGERAAHAGIPARVCDRDRGRHRELLPVAPRAMTRGRALAALMFVLAAALPASAQVVPNAHWRTIDTKHFHVHFTPELELTARRAAVSAERAYAKLAERLVKPRGPIDLVIADNVDFANGSTTPFPTNRDHRVRASAAG